MKISMKPKELKKFAERIAKLELIIDSNVADEKAIRKAREEILELSGRIDPEDMIEIDEIVQQILNEKS